MEQTFSHRYNIGDTVYNNSPDGDRGIVIDISYSVRNGYVRYEVVYGRSTDDDVWCVEEELSDSKVF